MVYSEFVWSGVVPLAIALEHAGFSRHCENNMLATHMQKGPAAGHYAILSGTSEVMGRKSFTDILDAVNNTNNKSGSKIKVVLLTQVASEGLTLKNVREVHIMEPWYHFNQLEQVIGRAVRTCSHEALPLAERNVTVYLHCAVADEMEGVPTPDEHAYEIAARKLGQIELVEKALRDNAIDCALNINVNYVPPATFGFQTKLNTSQGAKIDWNYGDSVDFKPKCKSSIDLHADNHTSVRHIDAMLTTAIARVRAHLLSHPLGTQVLISDLVAASKMPKDVAKSAVLRLMGPYSHNEQKLVIRLHKDAVIAQKVTKREQGRLLDIPDVEHIQAVRAPAPANAAIAAATAATAASSVAVAVPATAAPGYTQLLSMLPADDGAAKFTLYSMFTRSTFFQFAADVVAGRVSSSERAIRIFDTEGVWTKSGGRITGFVNIFTPRGTFEAYSGVDRASNAQTETLKAVRVFRDIPEKANEMINTIGFFGLKRDRAAAGDNVQLAFQLLMPNSLPGNQRGAYCETKGKDELKNLINTLTPGYFERVAPSKQHDFRKTLCVIINEELRKHNQLMYPPFYKQK